MVENSGKVRIPTGQTRPLHCSIPKVCCAGVHYTDFIMSAMASQITIVSVVCSTVGSSSDQRIHQTSRHWPLCGKFTGEFPAQKASNAETVSIWWRHHVFRRKPNKQAMAPTNHWSCLKLYWESYNQEAMGPCITNVFATRRKNFSQWHRSFQRKLRSHWLKFLRHVAITLVIQGPGLCGRLAKRRTRCKSCVNIATKLTKHTGITGEICYPNSICFVVISSVIPKSISETLARTSRNLSLVIMIHIINNPIILHPGYRMFLSWFAQVGKSR